jgi:hypothetical protein
MMMILSLAVPAGAIAGPEITAQPVNVTGEIGDPVSFTVAAEGSGLSYQWQYSSDAGKTWGNSGLPGNKTATLTTQLTEARLIYRFRCVVTDAGSNSVTSNVVRMYKAAALAINTQPENFYGQIGDPVSFTVAASGAGLTYQWECSSDAGKTWKASGLPGNKTSTLTTEFTEARKIYRFRCVVTDATGASVTSNVVRMYTASNLAITTQPVDFEGSIGDAVSFTVVASGSGLSYQWQYSKDDGATWGNSGLPGNKTDTLTTEFTAARLVYKFRCLVSDSAGNSVASNAVCMTVAAPAVQLAITAQPVDYAGQVGDPVSFTVAAVGSGLTYQWQYSNDGGVTWKPSGLPGNKTDTLTTELTEARLVYKFRCLVSDSAANSLASDAVCMTIAEPEEELTYFLLTATMESDGSYFAEGVDADGEVVCYRLKDAAAKRAVDAINSLIDVSTSARDQNAPARVYPKYIYGGSYAYMDELTDRRAVCVVGAPKTDASGNEYYEVAPYDDGFGTAPGRAFAAGSLPTTIGANAYSVVRNAWGATLANKADYSVTENTTFFFVGYDALAGVTNVAISDGTDGAASYPITWVAEPDPDNEGKFLVKTVYFNNDAIGVPAPFAYDGETVTFIKDDGAAFGMFTAQAGTTCVINGDNVVIHYVPKNTTVYTGIHFGRIVDPELTVDVALVDGAYEIVLPKDEYCGKAVPIAAVKPNGDTTSAQYYLAIPAANLLENVTPVEVVTDYFLLTRTYEKNGLYYAEGVNGDGAVVSYRLADAAAKAAVDAINSNIGGFANTGSGGGTVTPDKSAPARIYPKYKYSATSAMNETTDRRAVCFVGEAQTDANGDYYVVQSYDSSFGTAPGRTFTAMPAVLGSAYVTVRNAWGATINAASYNITDATDFFIVGFDAEKNKTVTGPATGADGVYAHPISWVAEEDSDNPGTFFVKTIYFNDDSYVPQPQVGDYFLLTRTYVEDGAYYAEGVNADGEIVAYRLENEGAKIAVDAINSNIDGLDSTSFSAVITPDQSDPSRVYPKFQYGANYPTMNEQTNRRAVCVITAVGTDDGGRYYTVASYDAGFGTAPGGATTAAQLPKALSSFGTVRNAWGDRMANAADYLITAETSFFFVGYDGTTHVLASDGTDGAQKCPISWVAETEPDDNGKYAVKTVYFNNDGLITVDPSITGIVEYNDRYIYVVNGVQDLSYTGLVQNDYGWWYVVNGEVDFTYTGLVENDYGTWYVESGAMDPTFEGIVAVDGIQYLIYNGQVAFDYSGDYYDEATQTTYQVVEGVVFIPIEEVDEYFLLVRTYESNGLYYAEGVNGDGVITSYRLKDAAAKAAADAINSPIGGYAYTGSGDDGTNTVTPDQTNPARVYPKYQYGANYASMNEQTNRRAVCVVSDTQSDANGTYYVIASYDDGFGTAPGRAITSFPTPLGIQYVTVRNAWGDTLANAADYNITENTAFYAVGFDGTITHAATVTGARGVSTHPITWVAAADPDNAGQYVIVTIYFNDDSLITVDPSINGLVEYNNTWVYVVNGVQDTTFTGLVQNQAGWWYVRNGEIDFTYTGLVENDYGNWYVVNGAMDPTFEGVVTVGGTQYLISGGKVATDYTGDYYDQATQTTYPIVAGIVTYAAQPGAANSYFLLTRTYTQNGLYYAEGVNSDGRVVYYRLQNEAAKNAVDAINSYIDVSTTERDPSNPARVYPKFLYSASYGASYAYMDETTDRRAVCMVGSAQSDANGTYYVVSSYDAAFGTAPGRAFTTFPTGLSNGYSVIRNAWGAQIPAADLAAFSITENTKFCSVGYNAATGTTRAVVSDGSDGASVHPMSWVAVEDPANPGSYIVETIFFNDDSVAAS